MATPDTTSPPDGSSPAGVDNRKLPVAALSALSVAAFLGILTEALPAGVLPAMARDMAVGESAMGQILTVYAIASSISAIPLSVLTAGWRRKPLILGAVAALLVSNVVTAVSTSYPLTMVLRFIGGVAAGFIWALLVEYARRLAPPHLQGRAIAVTMFGVPLALSLGIPAGTVLGDWFGWRVTFMVVAGLAGLLLLRISASVPDFPGHEAGDRVPIRKAFAKPGVIAVLFTVAAWVLSHNILYTYIATFLVDCGMGDHVGAVLLVFGIASLVGILYVGAKVDTRLRRLTIGSAALVTISAAVLAALAGVPALVYVAAVLWGLGWGGVTTLLQTAVTDAGGDSAQALLVTTWNGSMAGGGAVGGILLDALGPKSFPWSVLALIVPVLVVVVLGSRHAFPATRQGAA